MSAIESLYPRLTKELADLLKCLSEKDREKLEEIRVFCGRPVELVFEKKIRVCDLSMDERRISQLLGALSGFALYRFEHQMAQGYIPLPGGHRAGVCGRAMRQGDGSVRMGDITSICLRVARRVDGASIPVREYFPAAGESARNVLLMGAPGCGKTTVLRDAALFLSKSLHVAVADEREEIFPGEAAETARLDVLRGMDKTRAFELLIRSMAPQVILCDELGREEDIMAVLEAARSGVSVIASVHADGFEALLGRPVMRRLFEAGAFDRYVHLGWHGSVRAVWNREGHSLFRKERMNCDELGDRCDGHDCGEQRRISLVGWREKEITVDQSDEALSYAAFRSYSV